MKKISFLFACVLKLGVSVLLLGACSDQSGETGLATQEVSSAAGVGQQNVSAEPDDVIARVGDQIITYSQINTILNSSAVVGLSIPEFASPERHLARLTLLDNLISANLIYLDALKQGVDREDEYQNDLQRFSDAILATLYRERILIGPVEVTEEEIQAYFEESIAPGTEFTENVQLAIEATLQKQKKNALKKTMRVRLREGHEVSISEDELITTEDEVRPDTAVVASIDDKTITWGDVKAILTITPNRAMSARREALDRLIDSRILREKARAAGLQEESLYRNRVGEYRKTRLINFQRARLYENMKPTDEEVRNYFENNRDNIIVPETRSIQMVVLDTREEAEDVKQKIESGEITMHQAAADFSTVPGAKKNLGQMGWVKQGTGFADLDALTFSLGPDEIGGPVQSPTGWHLVKVLDQRDAALVDIEEEKTFNAVRRRILDERMDDYVINLRMNEFDVVVYDDVLTAEAQQEAEWYAEIKASSDQSQEKLKEQIEKLRLGQ